MHLIELAKKYLQWNEKNLVANAQLKRADLSNYFAETFQVIANGRKNAANYDNYFDFLNQFRSTIQSITYDYHDFIADAANVVIPLTAHIVRVDDAIDKFEAILILKFNQAGKIILWHEVYVKL